uniref:hypothetical protein n=1 Tax=Streptomyces anthocyanicus TaxID=68174 RepID=UPI002F90A3DC
MGRSGDGQARLWIQTVSFYGTIQSVPQRGSPALLEGLTERTFHVQFRCRIATPEQCQGSLRIDRPGTAQHMSQLRCVQHLAGMRRLTIADRVGPTSWPWKLLRSTSESLASSSGTAGGRTVGDD